MKAILSNQNSKNITVGGIGTSNTLIALVGAATDANTPTTLVKRNASGNFSAGTITAELNGNSTTTTKLSTARTISITGDIYYTSPLFDGSNDVTAEARLATVNNSPGSYGSASSIPVITVNSKGLITAISAANLNASSGFTLSLSASTGIGSVGLLNETLSFIGDTNIRTSVSGSTVTLITNSTPSFNTITSTVATGTPPFIVSSTTPVNNLSIGGNAATVTNGIYTTDVATVTNTMLAGNIDNDKLSNSSITIGSTAISLGSTSTTLTGLTSVTSTTFVGALTGNATNITAESNSTIKTLSALSLPYSQLSSAPTIGDGALTISAVAAAATNNTVTLALSGAYSANTSTSRSLDLKVGPALTNLVALMTTAGVGFIKRGATADTYTIDTNAYLTANSSLDANNITTGIINVARLPTNIAGRFLLMGA